MRHVRNISYCGALQQVAAGRESVAVGVQVQCEARRRTRTARIERMQAAARETAVVRTPGATRVDRRHLRGGVRVSEQWEQRRQ